MDAVSLIIPTRNKLELLRACLDGIAAFTPEPHEVIVVDGGSTDETAEYLRSKRRPGLRIRMCGGDTGTAVCINQGLRMARGSRILIWSEEVAPSEGWLANLLAPLEGREQDAVMKSSGHASVRGIGLLMARETFERAGFLDECCGSAEQSYADYERRIRLLGIDLVADEPAVGETAANRQSDMQPSEAQSPHTIEATAFVQQQSADVGPAISPDSENVQNRRLSYRDFYPTNVLVTGVGAGVYWLEQGVRYPIADEPAGLPAVRITQLDLKNLPCGEARSTEQAARRLAAIGSHAPEDGGLPEGLLIRTPDGQTYQHDRGRLRPVDEQACLAWSFDCRPIYAVTSKSVELIPRGLPIAAPAGLQAGNL